MHWNCELCKTLASASKLNASVDYWRMLKLEKGCLHSVTAIGVSPAVINDDRYAWPNIRDTFCEIGYYTFWMLCEHHVIYLTNLLTYVRHCSGSTVLKLVCSSTFCFILFNPNIYFSPFVPVITCTVFGIHDWHTWTVDARTDVIQYIFGLW